MNVPYPNRLKILREERQESVLDMAESVGVGVSSIYRWEDGTHIPRSKIIKSRMFEAYHTFPSEAYPTVWESVFKQVEAKLRRPV
jgi:transcriptional regulator with XRE-family HTH domain